MKKKFTVLYATLAAFFVSVLLSFPEFVLAAEANKSSRLVINTEHIPPLSKNDGTGFENMIAKEMYKRIGIDITFNLLPSERGLLNVVKGLDDGLLLRVGGIARRYPNLVQFEESANKTDYVAFARRTDIQINGWESLKPYDVGIITGWKILEHNIQGTRSLTKVKNAEQLFTLLDANRADVIVFARVSGLQMIRERGLKEIRVLEPPLATREKYFYLNKKHKDLVPRAGAALREMKADGTYQRIFDQTIKPLMAD